MPSSNVASVAFSPDGATLAVADQNGEIVLECRDTPTDHNPA
jgi:hypothetical protein